LGGDKIVNECLLLEWGDFGLGFCLGGLDLGEGEGLSGEFNVVFSFSLDLFDTTSLQQVD